MTVITAGEGMAYLCVLRANGLGSRLSLNTERYLSVQNSKQLYSAAYVKD
jgi:hypothetical protein